MLPDNLDDENQNNQSMNDKKMLDKIFDAIKAYDQARLENPQDATIWNNLGRELKRIRKYTLALQAYDKALEINPDSRITWNEKGFIFQHLGRTKEAEQCFTQYEKLRVKAKDIGFIPFVECITHKEHGLYNKLIAVLEARGFLLDRKGDHWVISDNSYPPRPLERSPDNNMDRYGDAIFLNEILTNTGIGEVKDDIIELIKTDLSIQDLVSLFRISKPTESLYARSDTYTGFAQEIHGIKLPVGELDPFIARLVKSISAIGIVTQNCCDGHPSTQHYGTSYTRPRLPLITFNEQYSAFWFVTLLNNIIRPRLRIEHQWYIDEGGTGRLTIPGRRYRDLDQVYLEIQQVAKLLYTNRKKFCDLKQELLNSYHQAGLDRHDKFNDNRERQRELEKFRRLAYDVIFNHQNDLFTIPDKIDCVNV